MYARCGATGRAAVHPLRGPELRALRQLRRAYPDTAYLFVSERGGPLTARAVHHIVLRAGEMAGLSFPMHPHIMLAGVTWTIGVLIHGRSGRSLRLG